MNYEDRVTKANIEAATPKIAAGTYTGDGAESRVIELGFTPKIVLICSVGRYPFVNVNGSAAFYYGGLATSAAAPMGIDVVDGGFCVWYKSYGSDFAYTNADGWRYNYIAVG